MINLTISVDNDVLKQARIRALQENTSVNAVLGRYIEKYAYVDQQRLRRKERLKLLLEMARKYEIDREGLSWNRDSLYER